MSIKVSKNVTLSDKDRAYNLFIAGLPGTGLNHYILNLIKQDINSGKKVIFLDLYGIFSNNHTDLKINSGLIEIIKLGTENNKYNFNIFESAEKKDIAIDVINLMYDLYDPNRTGIIGPRFEQVIRNGIFSVMYDRNAVFTDLIRLLTDSSYLKKILPLVKDPLLKDYWSKQTNNSNSKGEVLDYVISRFKPFFDNKMLVNFLDSNKGSGFEKLLSEKNIVVLDFEKFGFDKESIKIVNTFLLSNLITYFKKRVTDNQQEEINLYIDNLNYCPINPLLELIENSRKYKVCLTLITNNFSELNQSLQKTLLRIENLVCFRLSTADAKSITPEFHNQKITVDTLCLTKKYHTYIKYLKDRDIFTTKNPEHT